MGFGIAYLRKTLYYLRRNGLRSTWYAVKERLEQGRGAGYAFDGVSKEAWEAQREWSLHLSDASHPDAMSADFLPLDAVHPDAYVPILSILVPAYRTKEVYLRELFDCVLGQSYPHWQLVLADATEDDSVEKVAAQYRDERICYVRLPENRGISGNSNAALSYAAGDYVGLLDHDDALTADALYEMAARIVQGRREGVDIKLLYSDEDKCDAVGTQYSEPNRKEKFNLDLILGNNYICHFLMMETSLLRELQFRPEYDGAQDYDLVLRAAERLMSSEEQIAHIPKVLYHWRSHASSTSENPLSKRYAYEAGRRAVQDFADRQGWGAEAVSLPHPGFYGLRYKELPFRHRPDLAAIGGRVLRKGKIAGGRWTDDGLLLYEGLPAAYSGYLHRAVLAQDADAVDIRCICVREECRGIFAEITDVTYKELPDKPVFDTSLLPEGTDFPALSISLCRAFRAAGYRILYLPDFPSRKVRTNACKK